MILWLDTETFSETPITHGTYRYVQDSELMIVTWAVDDGGVEHWDRTLSPDAPADLLAAIRSADEIRAHNAMFDRNVVWKHVIRTPVEQWRCTMVQAMAHALPGSLDKLCELLHVPSDKAKIKEGKALVKLFCCPRPKKTKLRRATRETHPAEWAKFIEYARADIDAMREVHKRLPKWNYGAKEIALYHLDQRINDRGFAVDLDLANAALDATAKEQDNLAEQVHANTSGEVDRATKRDQMLDHILAEYGLLLVDLKGSTVDKMLDDPALPDGLRELLRIRQQASATSTSKYKRIVNGQTEGRMRGTLQFDGAGRTRRWSGRTFQPQNLVRGTMHGAELDMAILAIKGGTGDLVW